MNSFILTKVVSPELLDYFDQEKSLEEHLQSAAEQKNWIRKRQFSNFKNS